MRSNDRAGLEVFYNENKTGFINWAQSRFDCDQDTLVDTYQDAIVTLFFNIKEGKIESFDSTAEAYLFGIARNLLLKKNIKSKREPSVDDFSFIPQELDYDIYNRMDSDHNKYQLEEAFKKLKEKCRNIIYFYYYHRFSLDAIAHRLGYGNTDVVKSRKNQCMKNLKAILEN